MEGLAVSLPPTRLPGCSRKPRGRATSGREGNRGGGSSSTEAIRVKEAIHRQVEQEEVVCVYVAGSVIKCI